MIVFLDFRMKDILYELPRGPIQVFSQVIIADFSHITGQRPTE
jgi:hypothetical protein